MRKHMSHRLPVVVLTVVVALGGACGTSERDVSTSAARNGAFKDAPPPVAAPLAATAAPAPAAAERGAGTNAGRVDRTSNISFAGALAPSSMDASGAMLVRQGEASLEVRHIDDGVTKVRQTAAQFGGFVANTTLRNGKEEQRGATLEVRVPAGQFEPLLGALSSLGKVESVTASAQDVGEEYVDLGARATNARRVEARLVEMLATRTGKLSEVLTVEQELTRIREEIERYDARLRYLERRSAMSTLSISLHEPTGLIDNPRPGPIAEAIGVAWQRAVGVLAWCIASLGLFVPLGLLVLAAAVLLRRGLRGAGDAAGAL